MKPVFIKINCDGMYNYDEHRFEDTFSVLINVNKIDAVSEYIPDDEGYEGKAGVEIDLSNGNYIAMDYTLEQIEQMISEAIIKSEM